MAIRDFSGVPDHMIPDWLLQSRLRLRGEAEKYRKNQEYFEKKLALSPEDSEKLWAQWAPK